MQAGLSLDACYHFLLTLSQVDFRGFTYYEGGRTRYSGLSACIPCVNVESFADDTGFKVYKPTVLFIEHTGQSCVREDGAAWDFGTPNGFLKYENIADVASCKALCKPAQCTAVRYGDDQICFVLSVSVSPSAAVGQTCCIVNKCTSQTVTVNVASAVEFGATQAGAGDVIDGNTVSSYFTNSDPGNCEATYDIVTAAGAVYSGNLVSINAGSKIQISEANFDGTAISLKIRCLTPFGEARYKPFNIKVNEPCTSISDPQKMTILEHQEVGIGLDTTQFTFPKFTADGSASCAI